MQLFTLYMDEGIAQGKDEWGDNEGIEGQRQLIIHLHHCMTKPNRWLVHMDEKRMCGHMDECKGIKGILREGSFKKCVTVCLGT